MSVEQQIEKLNQEIKSVKTSFEQSANMMKIYTTEITFTTSMNRIVFSNASPYNPFDWVSLVSLPKISATDNCGNEPIVVTFDCEKGINTFATLEVKTANELQGLRNIQLRRLPYSGGSRWLVVSSPKVTTHEQYNTWEPSVLQFVVKSAVQGQLRAKMIWQ